MYITTTSCSLRKNRLLYTVIQPPCRNVNAGSPEASSSCAVIYLYRMVAEFKGDCNFKGTNTVSNYGTVSESVTSEFAFPFPSFLILLLPHRYTPMASALSNIADCRSLASSIAEKGQPQLTLLCMNQKEGHAEVEKIVIFMSCKLIAVFHCSACLLKGFCNLMYIAALSSSICSGTYFSLRSTYQNCHELPRLQQQEIIHSHVHFIRNTCVYIKIK